MKSTTLREGLHQVLIEPSNGLLTVQPPNLAERRHARETPDVERPSVYRVFDDLPLWLMEQGCQPYCESVEGGVLITFESDAATLKMFESICVMYRVCGPSVVMQGPVEVEPMPDLWTSPGDDAIASIDLTGNP